MRRTPGKTVKEREGYWIGIIHEARSHSAGVTAYCIENNISKSTFKHWFRRLRASNAAWQEVVPNPPMRHRTESAPSNVVANENETDSNGPRTRRKFTAEYKARIIREVEEAAYGKQAELLRREGINGSHLQKWRHQQTTSGLEPKKRGRKSNPLLAETKRLRKENAKLQKELEQARAINELQKKMAKLLS